MAVAAAIQPLVLKESIVEIGGTDVRRHVSGVTFTPSATSITWHGLSPDAAFSDVADATWTVAINYAQDWTLPASFSRYLFEHEGETVAMTFAPKVAEGASFTADVIITPGAIGGEWGAVGTASVTLGCVGRPELVETP